MDMGSTFPSRASFERVRGRWFCRGHRIPRMKGSPGFRAAPPRRREKPRSYGLLVRTKTDTGGMVSEYQGARVKPR